MKEFLHYIFLLLALLIGSISFLAMTQAGPEIPIPACMAGLGIGIGLILIAYGIYEP